MTDLQKRIKELEVKYKEQLKAEKAALMAKYRAEQKKKKEAELKQFIDTCIKYRKLLNDDTLLFGGMQHMVNTAIKNEQPKLDYFRGLAHGLVPGLVQNENNPE
jgi:menaquinone-dependent protoporphyrinogen IX oxidase